MDPDSSAEGGRSSRRDRLMGKLFKPKDKKLTSEESATDISDFLGHSDRLQVTHPPPRPPPFENNGPPTLALDTAQASKFTKAANYQSHPAQQQQTAVPYRTRSHSPPRPRKHKGLAVRFADTYPEIIGEGGDQCETATAEIGKRRRSKSAPSTAPIPPTKQGHQYARQVGAYQETKSSDDGFVPGPIRRTQTGFSSISDLERHDSSKSTSSGPPPDPPPPRTLPAGESVQSRFLDTSSPRDEVRRSFIETQQQEQRQAEGMALAEAMRSASGNTIPDWDEESPNESVKSVSPRRLKPQQAPSIQDASSPEYDERPPASPRNVPTLAESVSNVLRTQSTRSPLRLPEKDAARRSPLPPARTDSIRKPVPTSPLPPPSVETTRSPDRDPFNARQAMSPQALRAAASQFSALQTPTSSHPDNLVTTPDGYFRSMNQNPFLDRAKSLRGVVDAAGEEAFDTLITNTKHLYELFRLYAEQQKPLETCQPEDFCRAALWWFLKGRTELENVIRTHPKDPDDTRHLIARYQAYTDLAKSYWLIEIALPEIAGGKYSPATGEKGDIRQAITYNLRKCAISMKKNDFLPPEEPFLPQTMDKSIWLEYPSLSQDIVSLLNGVWGSALVATQQPTRTMDLLEALPIGDTAKHFVYTRVPSDVYLMEQGMENSQTYLPCMLSVTRSPDSPALNFVVASQNNSITLRIQSNKKVGPSWADVRWRASADSIEVKLPRGFILAIQCTKSDFKTLWGIFEFNQGVQNFLFARPDEAEIHSVMLKGFHYFDNNPQGRNFPKDPVGACQLNLFEKVLKESSPTGPRMFHRGFRLALVTGPRTRMLSGLSHNYPTQLPVQFAMLRGDERSPMLQLEFNDSKGRGKMVLSFNDEQEREKMLRKLCGNYVHHDEECVAEVPLQGMSISEGVGESRGGYAAVQRLPWQRARIINDKFAGETPQTVLAEKLRIEVDSVDKVDKNGVGIVSTVADRVNVAPGELKVRLGTKDVLSLQVLRQPQLDMTVSVLESAVPKETPREFAALQSAIQANATVRTYRFPSFKDLHAFQEGLTGYSVLFDGVAASLNISRRMMVVPIHKKWESGTARIQVVQQDKTVQLLAFFEDWHHGKCMGFVLKGTDVFESFSRNGKAGLKLADAKFPLPKLPTEGADKTDDAAFLCLDMPDFAGEHDDVTIIFDDGLERDRLCSILPAPVKGSRLSKVK
ncbi:hypothetical protein F5Y16DRAFT_354908 [Xylariaceae sp. FL0255]|nr:hypothetical protein F5Y16DRAFT_354908 [Xylariaceae sp. FL0255]